MDRGSVVAGLARSLVSIAAGVLICAVALRGLRFSIVFAAVACLIGALMIFRGLTGFAPARRKG